MCKAPFDVVQPKVPDKLCRVMLNRQELGGEIDRRIQNLIYKNFMVIDLDGGWLNHFRQRTDRRGASHVYYGIGKVLDAGSLFAAYTGDSKVAARAQHIIDELVKSRDPDGYLGFWKVEPENRQDHINWILHEQEYINLAFVRNYRCTGNRQVLADAKIMGDYILKTFPTPQNPCYDAGLICTAGLPEGMLELYRVTGDQRYLDFAADVPHGNNRGEVQLASLRTWDQDFSHRPCHVYVMLARCYAQTELFRLTGEDKLLKMSRFMRSELLKKGKGGMLVTGSSSQDEMFAYNQNGSGAIGESCVTAYVLRWIDSLMRLEGDLRYGDLMERTIYNALLGANSPDGRRIRYFTPFTGERRYDNRDTFCCCGNYRRAVAELPQKVYYRTPDGGIALNLFTNSKKAFDVNGRTVTIAQETAYPNDGNVKLAFSTPKPVAFAFQFRTPRWCEKITLRVNDEAPVMIDPLGRNTRCHVLNRTWKDGDVVKIALPMAWRFLRGRAVQDGRVVLLRGPVVYCVGKDQNAGLFSKCPDPRNLVIDPASVAEPVKDDSIRPGGLKTVAKAWLNQQRAGEKADLVLTEFIDPSGQEIYFRVPNLADTSPVRLMDDEIVSWPDEHINAQVAGKAEDLMKTYPASRLAGSARVAQGRLSLDGGGYLWAAKDAKLLTAAVEEETPLDTSVQTLFYKARSKRTGNMWDTWLYLHQGEYYLYYLAKTGGAWDNISMARSPDGVHWKEIGRVLSKGRDVTWMGTGSTWKSPTFAKDGKFFMNFSEWKGPRQTIFFAESTDLVHWTRLGNEYEFVQDERWYERNGRWDCIWTIPRPGGGLYGYWTAMPKAETGGRFGFGETLDGITWKALPPPKVSGVREGEVGAIERIGDRYYMMFGTHPTMLTLVADRPEGPFVAAKKNFCLLAGHTYFSRFLPVSDSVLVNHHSIARDGQVYFGTLKSALLDDAGTLRLGWWKGNDKLKHLAVDVKPPSPRPGETQKIAMIDTLFDAGRGLVLEGRLKLPASTQSLPVGLFVAQGSDSGTAVLVRAGGVTELGPMRANGTGFKAEYRVDREWKFGASARFRLLLKGSLIEFYLEDLLIDCYSLPQNASGRIGILQAGDPAAVTSLKAWCP